MTGPLLDQSLREGDFQAAWYYSIVLSAMVLLAAVGTVVALRAARKIWRTGDRGAALVIGASVAIAALFLFGILVAVSVALLRSALG